MHKRVSECTFAPCNRLQFTWVVFWIKSWAVVVGISNNVKYSKYILQGNLISYKQISTSLSYSKHFIFNIGWLKSLLFYVSDNITNELKYIYTNRFKVMQVWLICKEIMIHNLPLWLSCVITCEPVVLKFMIEWDIWFQKMDIRASLQI